MLGTSSPSGILGTPCLLIGNTSYLIIPGRTLPGCQEVLERTRLLLAPTVALALGQGFRDCLCHLESSPWGPIHLPWQYILFPGKVGGLVFGRVAKMKRR